MALRLEGKKAIVADVAEVAKQALSLVIVDYRGLSVTEMTELRAAARNANVYLRVVRNTLSRLALSGTAFECAKDVLQGPLCLAFSEQDPGAAARLLKKFAKEYEHLEVKALAISGELLEAKHLKAIADLPTRDEALSKLMFVMKAPIEKFVRTLAAPHTKLVRTLAAVRDKKQAG